MIRGLYEPLKREIFFYTKESIPLFGNALFVLAEKSLSVAVF